MLEHLFARTHVIARLRRGLLGSYLDDFATSLHQHGYAPSSIQGFSQFWSKKQRSAVSICNWGSRRKRTENVDPCVNSQTCGGKRRSLSTSIVGFQCTFRTLFRTSEAILAEPPLEGRGGA